LRISSGSEPLKVENRITKKMKMKILRKVTRRWRMGQNHFLKELKKIKI